MCMPTLQVQQRWQQPLASACSCLKQALRAAGYKEAELLGIYLRGSLPQGCAIEHISDIDLMAYVLSGQPSNPARPSNGREEVLQEELRRARSAAIADFEFVVKAGAHRQQLPMVYCAYRTAHLDPSFQARAARIMYGVRFVPEHLEPHSFYRATSSAVHSPGMPCGQLLACRLVLQAVLHAVSWLTLHAIGTCRSLRVLAMYVRAHHCSCPCRRYMAFDVRSTWPRLAPSCSEDTFRVSLTNVIVQM